MSLAELRAETRFARSSSALPRPTLAGFTPPDEPLSLFAQLCAMGQNTFAKIPRIAYEEAVWDSGSAFGNQLFVCDPAGINRVLLDNVANYPKSVRDTLVLSTAFGDGLLTSTGEKWQAHRKVMSPSFDMRSIATYAPAITDAVEARLKLWDASGEGAEIDIASEMAELALDVITRTMFSAEGDEIGKPLDESLRKGFDNLNFGLRHKTPVIGPLFLKRKLGRIRANFDALDVVMQRLIRGRACRSERAPKDLLDRLILARDGETGFKLSANDVRDEVIIIFLAGHETTALAATYVWYLLSLHPREQAKLHAELDSVLGGRVPGYEDLARLTYTRMVIDEAMRLYPPAPALSARVAVEPDEICGRRIASGAEIAILPWVLHRHRLLWNDPDRFDPERFSAEKSAARPRFAYLPFGAGPRICIGAALAVTEISLLLATMAQRYRLRIVPGQNIVLTQRVTMRPRDGIRMILERRR